MAGLVKHAILKDLTLGLIHIDQLVVFLNFWGFRLNLGASDVKPLRKTSFLLVGANEESAGPKSFRKYSKTIKGHLPIAALDLYSSFNLIAREPINLKMQA